MAALRMHPKNDAVTYLNRPTGYHLTTRPFIADMVTFGASRKPAHKVDARRSVLDAGDPIHIVVTRLSTSSDQ